MELIAEGQNKYSFSLKKTDTLTSLLLRLSHLDETGLRKWPLYPVGWSIRWSPKTIRVNALELTELVRHSPRRHASWARAAALMSCLSASLSRAGDWFSAAMQSML